MGYGNLGFGNLKDFSSGLVGKEVAKFKSANGFSNNFDSLSRIAKQQYRLKDDAKPETINKEG